MRLLDKKYFYLFDGFSPPSIITGFSKKNVSGKAPEQARKILSCLKKESLAVSFLRQPHSSQINFIEREGLYEGDGLFTSAADIFILVRTADCLPLFFYSKDCEWIGVVHMGWRSAEKGILDNIAYSFRTKGNLASFKVAAGVGLRECCYRVGKEFLGFSRIGSFIKEREGEFYFNPISFVKQQLLMYGLREENFFDSGICSYCTQDNFFSYRRNATSQRTISFIFKR